MTKHAALWGIVMLLALNATAVFAQPVEINQHSEEVVAEVPSDDETMWNAALGASLNTGNTRSWQLNTGSDFRLVRGPSAFGGDLTFAYGRADVADDMSDALQDTVKNFRAKLRYDYFFTRMDALFVAAAFRWDQLAGLDSRVQGQIGYLRNFFKEKSHRFWGEAGYDITFDNFHPDPLIDPDTGATLDGTAVVHSARAFLGYDNQINGSLTYLGGVEGLFNVEESKDVRINWDNALRSSIGGSFQLEVKFSLQFDNLPVPGARKTDTATLVSLLYKLIDETPPEPAPCDCPPPVVAPVEEAPPASVEAVPALEAAPAEAAPVQADAPAEAAPVEEAAPAEAAPAPPTAAPTAPAAAPPPGAN